MVKPPPPPPRSFAAELAKTPIQHVSRWFVGIDPDGHNTGVAWVHAEWTLPMTGPVKILEAFATLVSIPARLSGLEAVDAMTDVLGNHLNIIAMTRIMPQVTLVAEAQRVYPREEMTRSEVIAKANDLLRLAQITGAALAFANRLNWSYTSELPADWKQQKKKAAHHTHIRARLASVPVTMGEKFNLVTMPAKYGHAMDALGLGLWAAERAAAGTLVDYTPAQ